MPLSTVMPSIHKQRCFRVYPAILPFILLLFIPAQENNLKQSQKSYKQYTLKTLPNKNDAPRNLQTYFTSTYQENRSFLSGVFSKNCCCNDHANCNCNCRSLLSGISSNSAFFRVYFANFIGESKIWPQFFSNNKFCRNK